MKTVYLKDLIHSTAERLANTVDNPSMVSVWLCEKLCNLSHADFLTYTQPITPAQQELMNLWIYELTTLHKPLQYILGTVPFLELEVYVEPPILIPRPETEEWVAEYITQLTPYAPHITQILDLCSGTGCIALSLAKAFPQAQVTAVDIDPQACALIQRNAHHNNLTNITVIQSDLFSALPTAYYDIITANPPYIGHEEKETLSLHVRSWEAGHALFADDKGYALIERIIDQAHTYLSPAQHLPVARLQIEIGNAQQAGRAQRHYSENSQTHGAIWYDSTNKPRTVLLYGTKK